MRTQIEPQIEQDHRLVSSVREASRLLERELGPNASRARADWRLSSDDRGRMLVDLTVSDWTGAVTYRFAPGELADGPHMEKRLHHLWGDLLMVRSHNLIDGSNWELQQLAGAE
jgi:hypothetical protein